MCGITGIWAHNIDKDRIRRELMESVATLRHRGPDDEGIWLNESGIGFGHTRLSILDLSALGHQPMISRDRRYAIVFNGEIYNFAEIRAELEDVGHTFSGTGDTEVILQAFGEWGPDAVRRFIGMFAIALWDEHDQTLQLFRDRVGVKPLYFGWDGSVLIFGSELKALRAFRHWSPSIDTSSLGEFLQYGYISEDRTIFEGISKLKPGHRLSLRPGKQPVITQYWRASDNLNLDISGSDADIEVRLEALLVDAFRYRMVSDVPVGVFLSGGVDSSLVTALLAKHHEQNIRTFTIGFGEGSHDESRWAKKVAAHCGTNHTEYILGVNEALDIAKDWGRLFDEPFGDSSGIPTLLVSRLASNDVKVVLSADGGDEVFSGYDVYTSVLTRTAQLARIPKWIGKVLSAPPRATSPRLAKRRVVGSIIPTSKRGSLLRKLDRLRKMLSEPTPGRLMDIYLSYWQPEEIRQLIGQYDQPRANADSYPGLPATQMSLWDFQHYLPEDILTKVDRTTMAVSIEGREPLLDHRVIEFGLSLPLHLRRGELGTKHILKSILYKNVPRTLVDRPKQGFAIPLDSWLKTDLKDLVADYLSESRIESAGLLDNEIVQRVVKNFYAGDNTLGSPLWFLLAFEMWREQWY